MDSDDEHVIVKHKIKRVAVIDSSDEDSDDAPVIAFDKVVPASNGVQENDLNENLVEAVDSAIIIGNNEKQRITLDIDDDCPVTEKSISEKEIIPEEKDKIKHLQKRNLQEIRSTTQRLVRDSTVRLPCHRPKQRSLEEFLQRRKSVPTIPLNMNAKQLSIAWKHIEEREKEVEEFYRSDDEESIDDDTTYIPQLLSVYDKGSVVGISDSPVVACSKNIEASDTVKINEVTSSLEYVAVVISDDVCAVGDESAIEVSNCLKTSDQSYLPVLQTTSCANSERITVEMVSLNQTSDVQPLLNVSGTQSSMLNGVDDIPHISGQPDSVIDFERNQSEELRDFGVSSLMKRFLKHSHLPKNCPASSKTPTNLRVLKAETDTCGRVTNLSEEVLVVNPSESSVSRIKLASLKAELHKSISQTREEEWLKRVEEYKPSDKKFDYESDEVDEYEATDGDNDDDEEEEDGEEEEDDDDHGVFMEKKTVPKNVYIDDEAEVTGDEPSDCESVYSEIDTAGQARQCPVKDDNEGDNNCDVQSSQNALVIAGVKDLLRDGEAKECSEAELMSLCSGKFFTQLPSDSLKDVSQENTPTVDSEDISLVWPEESLLENRTQEITYESNSSQGVCDEDEDSNDVVVTITNKKRRQLVYSDEEEEEEVQNIGDSSLTKDDDDYEKDEEVVRNAVKEPLASHDDTKAEDDMESGDEVSGANGVSGNDFFEAEAELTESEWDSADEDERDLDKLEEEAGDKEYIDEVNLKEELGKIHMRRVLADDKHEVRLLQELLLEDGELHSEGRGRQRTFRWNTTDLDETWLSKGAVEEVDEAEEEEEANEQWRLSRHERETFLREKKVEAMDEDVFLVEKRQIAPGITAAKDAQPLGIMIKRGSFLSRGERVLSRLAELTGSKTDVAVLPKNSRNFLFTAVSPKKVESAQQGAKDGKRKTGSTINKAAKRICISKQQGKKQGLLDQLALSELNS